jgi:hypothetical protein
VVFLKRLPENDISFSGSLFNAIGLHWQCCWCGIVAKLVLLLYYKICGKSENSGLWLAPRLKIENHALEPVYNLLLCGFQRINRRMQR